MFTLTLIDLQDRLDWMRHQQRLLEAALKALDGMHYCSFRIENPVASPTRMIPATASRAIWSECSSVDYPKTLHQPLLTHWISSLGDQSTPTYPCAIEPRLTTSGTIWAHDPVSKEPTIAPPEEVDPLPLVNIARAFLGRRRRYMALVLLDGGTSLAETTDDDEAADEEAVACTVVTHIFLSHRSKARAK